MISIDLLISHSSSDDLEKIAASIFEYVDASSVETRTSSNYPPENIYFLGYVQDIQLKISHSDSNDHLDLPYWIVLSSDKLNFDELSTFGKKLADSILIPNGFSVAQIHSFGHSSESRIDF